MKRENIPQAQRVNKGIEELEHIHSQLTIGTCTLKTAHGYTVYLPAATLEIFRTIALADVAGQINVLLAELEAL